jgi:hypothetical protein
MHASRLMLSWIWIAVVQGICTTGTPAGDIALLGMAVSFLMLTLFALIMAIKGI